MLPILSLSQEVDKEFLDRMLEEEIVKKEIKNPEGKEFWLCFMRNHTDSPLKNKDNQLKLELFITSETDAIVNIEIEALNYQKQIKVPAGTVRNVKLNPLAQIRSSEVNEKGMGVHVSSDVPVTVYGLNRRRLTTDTFLALPNEVLGTEYLAVGYDIAIQLTAQFAIVATEDSTKVTIIPSVITRKNKKAKKEFTINLNKGDVYQVTSLPRPSSKEKADLTGSIVISDKKVAFFSGHQCAYVPENIHACNHLVEQIPPTKAWGTHYYIGRQQKRTNYTYRVLASENNTKIFEDYKLINTLNRGEYLEKVSDKDVQITADNPVLVAQYSQGFKNGDSIGDPMMMLISPTQQFLKKYRFATPVNGSWEHYINIVTPTKSIRSLRLDGKPIPRKKFKNFGTSRYSIAYIRVAYGTHEITGDEPFGMSSYGFGFGEDKMDAYGNIGGQSFFDYVPFPDTLAPIVDIGEDDEGLLNIFVRDDRINDKGIKKIQVISASNFSFYDTEYEPGTPQTNIRIDVADKNRNGSILLDAEDLAGNFQSYTICYNLDSKTGTFRYFVNEGNIVCEVVPNFSLSLFTKNSYLSHSADFSSVGNLVTPGFFQDGSDFNSGFGGILSYGILPKLNISGRLFFDKFTGNIFAPDTITSRIRVGNDFIPLQEGTNLEIDSWNINFGLSADYYFNTRFYIFGGFRLNYLVSNDIIAERIIIRPQNGVYGESNTNTIPFESSEGVPLTSLEELNQLGFGAFTGIGVSERVYNNFSLFAEITLDNQISTFIDNNDWYLWQFYINLGIKHPL